MPSKNSVNSKEVQKDLEKKISPVLVVNNSSLKPYVELFDYAPENIYQQPLGCLVGFFEIKEYSDDSAYVVNFLTSVLKKEYYINPKRPVTESLDSALHKVNMALSELAKHGNIEWLGRLNAAICVLEKNNAHFSVAGNAKIFLYRNQGLTEISEDLASDSLEPHPLKTFVNVSSGRMEKNDRLLITSEDIFHIFSSLEIKKNFQRFEGDKFVQFLKTALSNQMEMIASVVVEMSEAEPAISTKVATNKKAPRTANVFSEKTFAQIPAASLTVEESIGTLMDTAAIDAEYIDKKTGHIYVQGEANEASENPKMALYWDSTKEKAGEVWYLTKNETRRRFNLYKKQLAKKMEQRRIEKEKLAQLREEEAQREQEEMMLREAERQQQLAEEKEAERILLEKQELERIEAEAIETQKLSQQKSELELKQKSVRKQEIKKQKLQATETEKRTIPAEPVDYKPESSFQEKLQRAVKEQQRQAVIDLRAVQKNPATEIENASGDEVSLSVPIHLQAEIEEKRKQARIEAMQKHLGAAIGAVKHLCASVCNSLKRYFKQLNTERKSRIKDESASHITPHFSKIKKTFSSFTFKQKIYTLSALVLVFIMPLFIVHFLDKPKQPTITKVPEAPLTQADILSGEKNINLSAQKQTVLSRSDLTIALMTNVGPAAFTKNSVLLFNGNQSKEYKLPENSGSIASAVFMNDLSLILIMTDQNKVLSFSPISLKFTDNNISLSGKAQNDFFGTYLTYLYVLDSAAGQIYRYPRAEGGFGEKTNWLKSAASFSDVSSMTIDDNIYVVQNNQVVKFFKGQPQSVKFESSQTSINYDKIHTSVDSSSLYVLDKLNSRLIVFAKDSGNILSQYYNEELKEGSSLTVDEKSKTAYITTSKGLISITLQ